MESDILIDPNTNLEKTPFIADIIDDLVNHQQGKFMIATGAPGSGKSMAMIRIAEKVDPSFDVDRIAIGKTTDFLKLLELAIDGKLENGSVIMLDEAGIGMPAREWNSAQNRVLSLLFQVIRKLGLLVIMTVPTKRMVDIHAQTLMRFYATGEGIDYKENRSSFKIYKIKYNDWDDIILRNHLLDADGKKIKLWQMALPQTINFKEYEDRKDEMMKELLNTATTVFTRIEDEEQKATGQKGGKREILYPRVPAVQEELNCSLSKACNILGVSQTDYNTWLKVKRF